MKRVFILTALIIYFFFLLPKIVFARSGCCSHHGGVCGCGCCDGTSLSSTCAPYYPECSQPKYVAPTITKAPVIFTAKPSTPKPSTPKPTIIPTQTPTPTLTIKPTYSPTLEPEVKAASIENTAIPTAQSEKSDFNSKETVIGLGILGTIAGGSLWIIKKLLGKIVSIIKK